MSRLLSPRLTVTLLIGLDCLTAAASKEECKITPVLYLSAVDSNIQVKQMQFFKSRECDQQFQNFGLLW